MNDEMRDICEYLKKRGFECLSIEGYYIQVYRKGKLLVRIEDKEGRENGP